MNPVNPDGSILRWRFCGRAVARSAGAALALAVSSPVAEAVAPEVEFGEVEVVLVLRDGDRVRGRIVSASEAEVTFVSARFGTVVVARTEIGTIEPGGTAAPASADAATASALATTVSEPGRAREDSGALLQWLRRWKATVALSAEGKREGGTRSSLMIEAGVGREWAETEVRLRGRHEAAREGERTTDDIVTFEAYVRHDIRSQWFVLYSPEIEWNRGYVHQGRPLEYVWLKQQIGGGFNAIQREALTLRLGAAENLFNVWTLDRRASFSTNTESLIAELEWQLPLAIKISDRFAWYYSLRTGEDGFENRLDLSKQLTKNLHLGFRHEARDQIPNADVSDYTLWRVLLGLDF